MGRIDNDAAFFMSYVQVEDRGQAASRTNRRD
jgi:hypothetical protein